MIQGGVAVHGDDAGAADIAELVVVVAQLSPIWPNKLGIGNLKEIILDMVGLIALDCSLLANLSTSVVIKQHLRQLDIIWHAFKEYCTAKMVQRTAISSPHSGQNRVVSICKEPYPSRIPHPCRIVSCRILSCRHRPLVGSMAPPPSFLGKQSTFTGHLFVDKSKHQMQREMKEAVSTSHCSQPNTIEYEMAMEWRLLQSRSDRWWKLLYKRQGEELRKLKSNLKLK
ncbi:hypothetical protein TEA_028957 [Camellia sinensis var. sinensis]|uniref:Uncharacterized protein n=1 Tax=Camellia sinensis var. sinensis TaxID=542762 RepID=A0A4S4CYW2_CAMSN|nr:hypothetical protein TEA_028957 [Camellia sinensis var. sinensis]